MSAIPPSSSPAGPSPDNSALANNAARQYSILIEDTARLSDRRQTVTNAFLTANAVLFGAVGLVIQQGALTTFLGAVFPLVAGIAGWVLCTHWRKLLDSYRRILDLRFKMLEYIEGLAASGGFSEPVNAYQLEWYYLYWNKPGGQAPLPEPLSSTLMDNVRNQYAVEHPAPIGQTKKSRFGFGFTITELSLPATFRALYLVAILGDVVSLIILHYDQIVRLAASWGMTLPVFH